VVVFHFVSPHPTTPVSLKAVNVTEDLKTFSCQITHLERQVHIKKLKRQF